MKTAWDRVQLARQLERPKALDYINNIFDEFIELHGDRKYADDKSIVGNTEVGIYYDENSEQLLTSTKKDSVSLVEEGEEISW